MAGSYLASLFNFLRKHPTVLHSGCIIVCSYQQILISLLVPLFKYVTLVGQDSWHERQKTQVLVLPHAHCEVMLTTASISCVFMAPDTVLISFMN